MARRMNIFLKQGCLFFCFLNHFPAYLFGGSSVQCCCIVRFAYRVVTFGRTCLEKLSAASGTSRESSSISANGLQITSLSQGSFLPSVPFNRNKPGLTGCNGRELQSVSY